MGNFCEQYGILPIAPSRKQHIKHKSNKSNKYHKRSFHKNKSFQPSDYYNKSKIFYKKPRKNYKDKIHDKFNKRKIKCFKCNKYGHFANNCQVKQKINQLITNNKEREDLYKILKLRNTDSEDNISLDEYESSSSAQSNSSSTYQSPNINLGCNDRCCKSVNVLTKSANILSQHEEHEELLLEAISKLNYPEFSLVLKG
jgi:hypothetical protein